MGEDAAGFAAEPFEPLPRFRTMGRISRAWLLLQAGRRDEAVASYQQAARVGEASTPPHPRLPSYKKKARTGFPSSPPMLALSGKWS